MPYEDSLIAAKGTVYPESTTAFKQEKRNNTPRYHKGEERKKWQTHETAQAIYMYMCAERPNTAAMRQRETPTSGRGKERRTPHPSSHVQERHFLHETLGESGGIIAQNQGSEVLRNQKRGRGGGREKGEQTGTKVRGREPRETVTLLWQDGMVGNETRQKSSCLHHAIRPYGIKSFPCPRHRPPPTQACASDCCLRFPCALCGPARRHICPPRRGHPIRVLRRR